MKKAFIASLTLFCLLKYTTDNKCSIECLDKRKHACRCREDAAFCSLPDYKEIYNANCSCPCYRYLQLENGKCFKCKHYRKVAPLNFRYKDFDKKQLHKK